MIQIKLTSNYTATDNLQKSSGSSPLHSAAPSLELYASNKYDGSIAVPLIEMTWLNLRSNLSTKSLYIQPTDAEYHRSSIFIIAIRNPHPKIALSYDLHISLETPPCHIPILSFVQSAVPMKSVVPPAKINERNTQQQVSNNENNKSMNLLENASATMDKLVAAKPTTNMVSNFKSKQVYTVSLGLQQPLKYFNIDFSSLIDSIQSSDKSSSKVDKIKISIRRANDGSPTSSIGKKKSSLPDISDICSGISATTSFFTSGKFIPGIETNDAETLKRSFTPIVYLSKDCLYPDQTNYDFKVSFRSIVYNVVFSISYLFY